MLVIGSEKLVVEKNEFQKFRERSIKSGGGPAPEDERREGRSRRPERPQEPQNLDGPPSLGRRRVSKWELSVDEKDQMQAWQIKDRESRSNEPAKEYGERLAQVKFGRERIAFKEEQYSRQI
jgi:hypothetical protein